MIDISIFVKLFLCVLFLLIGAIFLKLSTKKKSKFGINMEDMHCPVCQHKLPKFRKPENLSQALWGGYTCANCKAEIDKWGILKKRAPDNNSQVK